MCNGGFKVDISEVGNCRTNDATQLRGTGACAGVTVHFDGDMMIQSKKEDFLNSKANKQRLIHYLSNKLERAGCSIDHATHDADVLIVQTAVGSAQTKDTVLIGDDTDLLILLLHHVEMDAHGLFMAPEPKQSTKKKVHKTIQGVARS